MSKAFIGRYFETPEKAVEYYKTMSGELRLRQSVCQVGDKFFILGDIQIEALKRK